MSGAGATMAGYRLYFLDDAGRIRDAHEFDSHSDEQALTEADARHDGRAMELWCGARVVRKILARPPA